MQSYSYQFHCLFCADKVVRCNNAWCVHQCIRIFVVYARWHYCHNRRTSPVSLLTQLKNSTILYSNRKNIPFYKHWINGRTMLSYINHKKCPAKVCRPLLTYKVDAEKCTGCMVCMKNCPSKAITGERKQVHLIDQELCTKCGVCFSKCKFDSILLS